MNEQELKLLVEDDKLYLDQTNYKKLKPTIWRHLDAIEFPPQKWLIKHLIPCQGVVILASASGEKKTWIALEMAKSISMGINFLNSEEFPTEKGNVLYIDQEMSQVELQRRGRQLGFKKMENQFWIISNSDLNLNSKADEDPEEDTARQLNSFIRRYKIRVVFIDTFRAVAGGLKEDKAEEVRAFFNKFKALKDEGVTLVFLDHCRKPLRFEGKAPKKEQLFASQDKVASVEVLLMIKSDESSEEIQVHMKKNRLCVELKPFTILMKDTMADNGDLITTLSYGGSAMDKESKVDEAIKLIPAFLEDGPKLTSEILEYGLIEWQIGEKNMRAALKALEDKAEIVAKRVKKGKLYSLPVTASSDQEEMAPDTFGI